MALTKIDDRGLKTPIDLLDSEKIRLGTGNDLEIYHIADSYSYIQDSFGNLRIDSDIIELRSKTGYEKYFKGTVNGAVELYYDNSKKFETTSWGTQVTGNFVTTGLIDLSDGNGTSTSTIALGDDDDLKLYHDGSHSYIKDAGTGNLIIQTNMLGIQAANGLEDIAKFSQDGAVELYHDNSKKFETFSGGISVTGNVNADGFHVGDTEKYVCGDGNDLEIKHASGDNYIWGTTNCAIAIGTNATSRWVFDYDGMLRPSADSVYDLGTDSNRVRNLYADSVITTADTGYKYSTVTSPNNTNIPYNTWTTISTNYGWSLPSAGTYLLSSSMRVRLWDVTGLIQARLYDNTNSSAVSDSVRMMWEQQSDTLKINVQITLQWVHTCTGAVDIYQQFNTTENSSASSIQNDANGANNVYWQRIG